MLSSEAAINVNLKAKALLELTKPKLTLLVLFSALIGFFLGQNDFQISKLIFLIFGGYLVTGSANTFNQIIEKDLDKKMNRTKNRPIPSGRLSNFESFAFAVFIGLTGLVLLFAINEISGWLGIFSMFLYVVLYTPLKRVSHICVFVGALPGAFPPMLGWVAATNTFGLEPGLLFLLQFAWQFPHFWAIAWKLNEDYSKAGFKMLPISNKLNKRNAAIVLLYTIFIIPVSYLLFHFKMCGYIYLITSILAGIYFIYTAYLLYQRLDSKSALKLMMASFIYLPVVQIFMLIDKI